MRLLVKTKLVLLRPGNAYATQLLYSLKCADHALVFGIEMNVNSHRSHQPRARLALTPAVGPIAETLDTSQLALVFLAELETCRYSDCAKESFFGRNCGFLW